MGLRVYWQKFIHKDVYDDENGTTYRAMHGYYGFHRVIDRRFIAGVSR